MPPPRNRSAYRPSLIALLLCAFLGILWLAGGASREGELGQVVIRGAAAATLIVALLFGPKPALGLARPALIVLAATILIAILQLVPLPPGMWQSLPGREPFAQAIFDGGTQPWRPIAIVPGAAFNAAASLIVPATVLLLLSMLTERDRQQLPAVLIVTIAAAALLGLLQFSGGGVENPLINETPGQVSGNFANRNHFALFIAFGFLLVPVWVFEDERGALWRIAAGAGLILLFTLIALATGSRAGTLLNGIAFGLGILLSRGRGLRRLSRRLPGWAFPTLLAGFAIVLGGMVLISVMAERAIAIDRLVGVDLGQDMRGRGLPVVVAMIREYFPLGSGLGSFDPIFRIHEPMALLKLSYFNHAHNDFLEIALDAGLPGLLLLAAALFWWAYATVRVWRAEPSREVTLGRLGSSMLLLVFIASIFDYPARTPMIMAMIGVAAIWLSAARPGAVGSALPGEERHL